MTYKSKDYFYKKNICSRSSPTIESHFLESQNKKALTHGETIAIGIIELYYSSKLFDFPMQYTKELKDFVNNFYRKIEIKNLDFSPIIDLMQYDKKMSMVK